MAHVKTTKTKDGEKRYVLVYRAADGKQREGFIELRRGGHVLEEGARMGARRATLEVRRSNEAARRLYERFGFADSGQMRLPVERPAL